MYLGNDHTDNSRGTVNLFRKYFCVCTQRPDTSILCYIIVTERSLEPVLYYYSLIKIRYINKQNDDFNITIPIKRLLDGNLLDIF